MYIRVGINMKKRIQFIIDELLKENFITVKKMIMSLFLKRMKKAEKADLNLRQNLVIQ